MSKRLKIFPYNPTIFLLVGLFFCQEAIAQDLEPRFLSNVPLETNILVASYGYSTGNIMLDNTLPIEDLNSKLNSFVFGYVRSFKLFNKPAKFDAILPTSFGKFDALVEDEDASANRNGFGDPSFRLSMILIGAEPLELSEFMKQESKKFKLGALLRTRIPLGQYNPEKLINLGTNRYAFKVGLAGSYTFKKKIVWEVHLNSWYFTKNNFFFGGNTIKQKPLLSLQSHVTYEFKPGTWLAFSIGGSTLGETIINGTERDDLQKNSRIGLAFAYRLTQKSSLKIAATTGVTTRYSADYTTFLLAYQFMWFDKTIPN